MKNQIVVPAAGESVTEADIVSWYKNDGDFVEMDEPLLELETDKASMDLNAETSGTLHITVNEGTVKVGDIIGEIDSDGSAPTPAPESTSTPTAPEVPAATETSAPTQNASKPFPSPAAKVILEELNVSSASISGTGKDGRITKADVLEQAKAPKQEKEASPATKESPTPTPGSRETERVPMTRIRKTIMNRLVTTQKTGALLTTFNEVDMSAVMDIRKQYKESFKDKYDVNLGFMSFFTSAVCSALEEYPIINAQVQDNEIIYHNYADVGIAVATPKGLVVPVIRNANTLSFNQIEQTILNYAKKGRDGKLTLEDMEGGTFTITNGGVFGSMLSTPIINYPQSAILGMHNIVKRPVVVNDEVVVRPIMYLALTYDHRIIDGAEAVRFLVHIKEQIEDPTRLLLGV